MGKRKTKEEFIKEAKAIHGDKYDYSKVEYKNNKTKVAIICPKHGEFQQTPNDHLHGGCMKCGNERKHIKMARTKEEFISASNLLHNNKYDYSKVDYVNAKTHVKIICHKKDIYGNEHGEFLQTPSNHLQGKGCPMCGDEMDKLLHLSNTKEFIEKAHKVHGDKYNYSNVEYKTAKQKISIICPKHGEFQQTPDAHLQGKGCPICNRSYLEINIAKLLEENDIEYEEEKRFPWLKQYELDFYLPQYNVAIECQGIQHFESVKHFGGDEKLKIQLKRDEDKYNLCKENGVEVFYVAEDSVLDKYLHSYPHKLYSCSVGLLNEVIGQ